MTREQARAELNSRPITDFYPLERSRNGSWNSEARQYVCPICGSGAGKNHSGALTLYVKTNRLYCFKCSDEPGTFGGKGQDTLGGLRILWRLDETETLERAGYTIDRSGGYNRPTPREAFGETSGKPTAPAQGSTRQTVPYQVPTPQDGAQGLPEPPADYTGYYAECRQRLRSSPAAISYLHGRGIRIETAEAAGIGFDPAADPAQSNHPTARIIMPTCSGHYVARGIDPSTPKAYQKMNPKGAKAGIFNDAVLWDSSTESVFVTEGYFDALSILEIGSAAIALNSTSNAGKLIEQLQKRRTSATLILCLDNDDAGKKATETLKSGLQRLNISYVTADICGGHKDPNEALTADREAFMKAVMDAERQTAARPDCVSAYIDTLMSSDIARFKEANNRKTGFPLLDAQARGLYTGVYVVGAISSLGKTTFCTQLADQLAEAGEDVLFFSLEQSRLEIVSKSLARRTAQQDISTAVDSLSIRRGYLPVQVLTAAGAYKAAIGDRLSIIEGNLSCNITFIGDYIRRYVQKTGKNPVVFVDYLQILQPEKDDRGRTQNTKETVDSTVTELKRLSRELNLTVFVISSLNRSNYLSPVDFESFKESGGIEYTADVVWGLQLQCMNDDVFQLANKTIDKRKAVKAAKAADPRKIELVCLKNRYGICNYSAYFDYYPKFDLYTERQAPTIFDDLLDNNADDDEEEDTTPKRRRKGDRL
jgi:replicative DNA helicase